MKVAYISRISLPVIDNIAPGLIHSLCHDCEGNIYCSDEFNHRIISLNPKGGLRWVRGEKGDRRSEFRYPRGISLGCVNHMGKTVSCVAVCDAWNHRVQIFGLDGGWLAEWTHAESEAFCEVVDIKSVCTVTGKKGRPDYWLILDRTGHRIVELGPGGELRGHSGQLLPPLLEAKWAKTILTNLKGMAGIESVTEFAFDPLFYPTRLIGNAEDALFVWEPLTMRLKQLAGGCLFPLNLKMDQAWECMDATPNEFLGWIPSERCLALFDYQGKLRSKVACDTRPIIADISQNQVWLQEKDTIVHIELGIRPQSNVGSGVCTPLLRNMETEIGLLKEDEELLHKSLILLENISKVRNLCEQIWQLTKGPSLDAQIFESLQKGLTSAVENLGSYAAQREDYLLEHPLLFLKVHWLRLSESGKDNHPAFSIIGEKNCEIAALFVNEFIALQQYFDDFSIDQADIASANPGWTAERRVCTALDAIEKSLIASLRSLESAVRSLYPSPESSLIPNIPDRDPGVTPRPIAATNTEPASAVKPQRTWGFLREIDRVSLRTCLGEDCPAGPYGLTSTSNGHVFVALRLVHCVAELNQEYQMLRCLGQPEPASDELDPLCIAADSSDRLWITELSKNRLKICDPGSEYGQFIPVNLDCPTPLHMPYGICRWRDSQVLIADTLNNRILAISDTGFVEIFADGKGSNPGQFLHPTAVVQSSSGENAGIWVVDHRNHRVQKLDASGRFLLTAGKPGLGHGSLTLPLTAAVFTDGSLLVAQHMITRCLALFAPDGKELDLAHLDFTPAGMLVHGDNLVITDADGDCLRIFRRFWSNNPC